MLYIAYESPGLIVGFDPISGNVRWRRPLGDVATDVQVDSTSHLVYATSTTYRNRQSDLSILDGATGRVLSSLRTGFGDNAIAFDAGRHRIYVANSGDGSIYSFTLLSGWSTGEIQVQAAQLHITTHPQALGVNSRLGRLYVADGSQHTIIVVDEDSGGTLATVAVGDLPVPPLRVDEATGRVYVVCSTGQELDVIDGNTNTVIARTPVAPYPEGVAFNSATGRIYVANEGDREGSNNRPVGDTISVLDKQSLNVLGTLQVGRSPDGIEADPALHLVYIAVENTGAVVELSDSFDLPLKAGAATQTVIARQAISVLQQATLITIVVMILTIVAATLRAQLQHWRARGSPQTPPVGASSRPGRHSLPR
jgi:YVTN family beta-propeller protein